jgi:hypothetical protein
MTAIIPLCQHIAGFPEHGRMNQKANASKASAFDFNKKCGIWLEGGKLITAPT